MSYRVDNGLLMMKRVLFWTVFVMVAVDSVQATDSKDFNIGRAFAHCTKLTKSNYDIWLTGLISTIVGITGVRVLQDVKKFLEYFEKSGGENEAKIDTDLRNLIDGSLTLEENEVEMEEAGDEAPFPASSPQKKVSESDGYSSAATVMFTVILTTIDTANEPQLAKVAAMPNFRGHGPHLMKHIYDKLGPGSVSRQTAKRLRIQHEQQSEDETGEEFCDRLIQESSSLTVKIDGPMLCSIFIRGLKEPELQKYLLGEQLKDNISDLAVLKDRCDEYEVRSEILNHGVDGLYAGFGRGGGRGRGRGGRFGRGGFGRGGRGDWNGEERTCNFCKGPHHFWRACRFLNRAKRHPNTTTEQHAQMDRKRDEFLQRCTPEFRRQIDEFLREQGAGRQVDAQMAQPLQQQAQLEFPNVDGRIADVVDDRVTPRATDQKQVTVPSKSVMAKATMDKLWKVFLALLALLMSCSGIILMLALFMQFGGTSAEVIDTSERCVEAPIINLPSYALLADSSAAVTDRDALLASPLYRSGAGVPWDTCAGINMFNSPAPFYRWDANATRYKINGATASDYSKGSGRVLIGFIEDRNDTVEWYDAPGIYVPGLSESLLSSVWFALERGVFTTVNERPFIMTCSGKGIPLEVKNNVTRCKHIKLFYQGMEVPVDVFKRSPGVPASGVWQADARAAVLVDKSRDARNTVEEQQANFEMWTKRFCGLSPEAVSHLQSNTVGCECPDKIPKKYKDLRWWSSAVAGKSRHSSHPAESTESFSRFRECVAMDFLEFTIDEVKFHVHVFVDYYSTAGFGKTVRSRSGPQTASNLLWFLNLTEMYVNSGKTLVRLKHDRAREFLSRHFSKVAVYSEVVQFALVPYEHEMNGLVERLNQTLQRMVTVVMHDSNMPMKYVVYAVDFCLRVYNSVPVQALGWRTRWEVMTGNKPDVRYIYFALDVCVAYCFRWSFASTSFIHTLRIVYILDRALWARALVSCGSSV